ncbi:MaoC/PaaZ C-terminal domain-containing protein [Bacillus tianshenii]|nr:MaoC/PaaZ C-terminal domain-containing protein [Bacillus tianshenii]
MYIEELEVGQVFKLEPVTVSEEEVFSFAEKYDPQPIHIDREFANNSVFKGVIASGFQTVALVWEKWIRAGIHGEEIIGGTGIDHLRWHKPVYPNDTLYTEVKVSQTKVSSRGSKGTVTFEFIIYKQNNDITTTFEVNVILKAKNGSEK